jgi:pimeloyl-ACP methyl ester carboxylesterase
MIFLRFLLVLPLSLVLAYAIYSLFRYTRMVSNIFLSLVYQPTQESFSSSMGEVITILDSGDHEIETLLLEKKDSNKLAIFCHESGSSKESWEKYTYFLPKLGFSVLSVDFQDKTQEGKKHALSQWPTTQDVERLLKVIHWSKRAFSLQTKIVLFGVSNGADIALGASFHDPAVKAVVADGLFSMKEIFRDYIRKWAPILVKPNLFGERYPAWVVNTFTNLGFWYSQKKSGKCFVDVEALLRKKHVPLLMIHGQEDDYILPTHQKLLEKIDSQKNTRGRLVIPRARHNEAVMVARELYEKRITNFLEAVV